MPFLARLLLLKSSETVFSMVKLTLKLVALLYKFLGIPSEHYWLSVSQTKSKFGAREIITGIARLSTKLNRAPSGGIKSTRTGSVFLPPLGLHQFLLINLLTTLVPKFASKMEQR